MNFDYNSIGRKLFEKNYNCKRNQLAFSELKELYDTNKFNFINIVKLNEKIKEENSTKANNVWINLLKQILLICYIRNVNLNDYFEIKTKE